MRSADEPSDLTARALIRDRALELFAAHGVDAVTVRAIAAAAGVSPALVLHHFGSKEGLRAAVDAHVAGLFDDMLARMAEDPGMLTEGRATASFSELMLGYLPPGSALPAYLRRLLLGGEPAGLELFRRWFALTLAVTEQLAAAGVMRPTDDPAVRAAFLLVNDLALVLLRDQVADVLGVDPLTPGGMGRWAADAVAAYTHGVFIPEAP
ncbi:MAG: TetR family transcriptional regulator [Frankiales bacterium]|nr:TetR family transcriptional regulator [Frankiales bacterium]